MGQHFKVFKIQDGQLVTATPLPDYLFRTARDAYFAVRNSGPNVPQSRIEELAEICFVLLDEAGISEPREPQPVTEVTEWTERQYPGDVEVLCEALSSYDHDARRYNWAKKIPSNGGTFEAHQLMAAYALQRVDAAAAAHLSGNTALALQLAAEACSATADYGFHGGFEDHITMLKEDSSRAAEKGWAPMKAVQARAIELWRNGRWKSMRHCSMSITQEIVALAASKGRPMRPDNATRTIYDWIRASEKPSS